MRTSTIAVLALGLLGCPTAPAPLVDAGIDAGPTLCPELALLAPMLDFGCVGRGDSLTLPAPDSGTELGISSAPPFSVEGQSIRFTPTTTGQFVAAIPLFRGECIVGSQPVIGDGVDAPVKWEPALVDFGYVPLTATKPGVVTFRSCAARPLTLQSLTTREGTSPTNTFGIDAGNTTIPAATRDGGVLIPGELALGLSFTPTTLGPRQGSLSAAMDVAAQSMVSVQLRGVGGGPEIDVSPKSLAFGAVTTTTTATITVSNVGTRPNPPDPRGNLHLGIDGNVPYFEIAPADCFTVTLGSYDTVNGIEAPGSVTVSVTVQPTGMPRVCTLDIFSNDPINPDVEIAITAQ